MSIYLKQRVMFPFYGSADFISFFRASTLSIKLIATVYIQRSEYMCIKKCIYIYCLQKSYTISLHVICIRVSVEIAFPSAQFLFFVVHLFSEGLNKKGLFSKKKLRKLKKTLGSTEPKKKI